MDTKSKTKEININLLGLCAVLILLSNSCTNKKSNQSVTKSSTSNTKIVNQNNLEVEEKYIDSINLLLDSISNKFKREHDYKIGPVIRDTIKL